MKIRTAYAAVGDLDVDVGLLPRFGRELLPDHLAFSRGLVEAHPSHELVVGGSVHDFRTHWAGVVTRLVEVA